MFFQDYLLKGLFPRLYSHLDATADHRRQSFPKTLDYGRLRLLTMAVPFAILAYVASDTRATQRKQTVGYGPKYQLATGFRSGSQLAAKSRFKLRCKSKDKSRNYESPGDDRFSHFGIQTNSNPFFVLPTIKYANEREQTI